jgi:hypothetical protein
MHLNSHIHSISTLCYIHMCIVMRFLDACAVSITIRTSRPSETFSLPLHRTMFNIVIQPNEITSCFNTVCIGVFVPLSRRCLTNGLAMLVLMFVLNRSGTFKVNSSNAIFINIVNSTVHLCNYYSVFDRTSEYFFYPLPRDMNIKS